MATLTAERAPRSAAARSRSAMPLVPALVALGLSVLGSWNPSFWLDEAATISIAQRPVSEMARFFAHQDLVHAFYYLLMHPWIAVFGTGEVAMRLPSALAMAAAAGGIAVVGRRLASATAGLLSGLAFACSVTVTRYGQEARSYALVAAAAVLATYLFVRAVEASGRRWGWWSGYAVTLVVLGALHTFGILLVAAHLVTILWAARRRPVLVGWLVAIGAAVAALAPLVLAARGQSKQVSWIPSLGGRQLWDFVIFLAGGKNLVPVVAALAVVGVLAGSASRSESATHPNSPPGPLTPRSVAVPWLLVPPALLMAASLVEPSFLTRYVLFCIPGLALLVGAGLTWLIEARWWWPVAVVVVALLAVLSIPGHVQVRQQKSKLDDLRAAADVLRTNTRPGDALLFLAPISRWGAAAYPDAYRGLRDVMLVQTPEESASLRGVSIKRPLELQPRLRTADRVWVMWDRSLRNAPSVSLWQLEVLGARYRAERTWRYKGGTLTLYVTQ